MIAYDDPDPDPVEGFAFALTAKSGFNSGRRRWLVRCASCGTEVHPATTGPESVAAMHQRECEGPR